MLHITPDVLEGAYEFFRRTKPFKGWILPHPDEIVFQVSRDRMTAGHFIERRKGKKREWVIGLSEVNIGHTTTLMRVMAHEMIHLVQAVRGVAPAKAQHNAEFWRLAACVARHHGFDPKEL